MTVDILEHFGPEVGGRDFQVGFLSCIVSSKDAVVVVTHGYFPVLLGEVEHFPG